MVFSTIRAFIATATLVFSVAAHAAPVTYTFTGVITYDVADNYAVIDSSTGQTVSGYITVDPDTMSIYGSSSASEVRYQAYINPLSSINGATYFPNIPYSTQTTPSQVSGQASGGGYSQQTGGSSAYDLAYSVVSRNYFNTENRILVEAISETQFSYDKISLEVTDFLGLASNIFADASGGIGLDQPIDWTRTDGDEVTSSFSYVRLNYGQPGSIPLTEFAVYGYLTSLKSSIQPASQVPEPGVLSLFGLALGGLTLARRRRI